MQFKSRDDGKARAEGVRLRFEHGHLAGTKDAFAP